MELTKLKDIAEVGVSHNPEIKKRVLIPGGEVPHITQFSKLKLTPGQVASAHSHPDMYEVFCVEAGEGSVVVNGRSYDLSEGVCITVEPGEDHEVSNTGSGDLIITMLGIEG